MQNLKKIYQAISEKIDEMTQFARKSLFSKYKMSKILKTET